MKRILFFTSTFMDIYRDVQKAMEKMGFEVVWVEASTITPNPYNKLLNLYTPENIRAYLERVADKWERILAQEEFQAPFDYFFAINGLDVHPKLFDFLTSKNPNIYKILYLYDRVDGVIQLDEFFNYYDRVFSFDLSDCDKYHLNFLPIYWIPSLGTQPVKYHVFGLASYSFFKPERTALYQRINDLVNRNKLKGYIKLYINTGKDSQIKFWVKNIIKRFLGRDSISLSLLSSELTTFERLSPSEYRDFINGSDTILDTQAQYQDGLTARFMWAVGAGKKIITTNPNIKKYDFYSSDQFYILSKDDKDNEALLKFLMSSFKPSEAYCDKIRKYRIDNWIQTILCQ